MQNDLKYEIWATADWLPDGTTMTGTDATDYANGLGTNKSRDNPNSSSSTSIEKL
jgi:hypothetical protein